MIKQLPNIISLSRIIWAGVFYVLVMQVPLVDVKTLLILFALIEVSDLLDGMIARLCLTTSNVGKLLDPVCDITAHFLCLFALYTLYMVPAVVVVIFVIREIWITFLRALLLKQDIVFASRWAGKLKTWAYALALLISILLLPQSALVHSAPHIGAYLLRYVPLLYYAGAALSILSGLGYVVAALHIKNKDATS